MTGPGWRSHLTENTDLAIMAAEAMQVDPATLDRSEARFSAYGLTELRASEMPGSWRNGTRGFPACPIHHRAYAAPAAGGNEHVVQPEHR